MLLKVAGALEECYTEVIRVGLLIQATLYKAKQLRCCGVPGEIKKNKRSSGGRWSPVSPEIMSREVELGCESRTPFASSFPQQQCNGHCPCDSAQARQLKQQLRSALVAGQWRGDTALTLPLFWRRFTVSPVLFGRYPRSSLHSFGPYLPPSPHLSPSLISHLASVDVKQNVLKERQVTA